ncbi:MAG TPA: hypothetical protein VFR85_11680 [Anaeromyxobacteraceae bacterium]|nr:hypothetical protein [Anaeromyxobacteraceae bacterium]
MLAVLSAMLVMMESGSVPAAPRLDLSADAQAARLEASLPSLVTQTAEGPVRLARALTDCDPGIVGIDPGADRLAASQDLLVCQATMLKDEPVGRAVLWLGSGAGLQASVSTSRVYLNFRFAP